MQNGFIAEDFLKLIMLYIQGETGYVSARNGACLYKQDFSAFYSVEAVVLTSSGLGRFCTLMEKAAEDSIHDQGARHILRTYIVIPAEQDQDGTFKNISGEFFVSPLEQIKRKCEQMGFLAEFAVADTVSGSLLIPGQKKLTDKSVFKALGKFIEENSRGESSEVPIEEKLRESKENIKKTQQQAGMIKGKMSVVPLIVLIAANCVIFLLGMIFENKLGYDPLLSWGIQNNELICSGEIWRLFTSMFLHADATHLFGNMLMLLYLGRIALKYYTAAEFFVMYFISGLVGNLLSFFFTDYLSLGASGAIMGLGGMLIYRMFFGEHAKSFRMAGNYAVMVFMVVFNLFYGLFAVGENIDNFGHFGGFFGGLAMAWLISFIRKRRKEKNREGRNYQE